MDTKKKKLTLDITHPLLCKEWDYSKNGDKTPDQFTHGCGIKVWWVCKKDINHSWNARICLRTGCKTRSARGCPFCGIINQKQTKKNKIINGVNLTITNPLLLEEWHPIKNCNKKPEEFTSGSDMKIWWLCKKDHSHEWLVSIKERAGKDNTINTGCPFCCGKRASYTNNLTITNQNLVKEWDYEFNDGKLPEDFTRGSHYIAAWICKDCKYRWKAAINGRVHKNGCPQCGLKKRGLTRKNNNILSNNNLTITNPELCLEWHPIENGNKIPEQFTRGSREKIWWQCLKNNCHKWQDSISHRTNKRGCPYCHGKVSPENNLTITNPELCKEWHFIKNGNKTPEQYTYGSNKKIWWICIKDSSHEWKTSINSRVNTGCPFCSGNRASIANNLTTTNPKLVLEWHQTKNGDKKPEQYTSGSGEKVWWQCKKHKNHEWKAAIYSRAGKNDTINRGCKLCSKGSGEEFTRYGFEKLLNNSFPTKRPDFLNNPKTGRNLELDGFCEEIMVAFEYQGNQHNKIIKSFKMSEEDLNYQKLKDQFKRDKCKEFGVKLIEIPQFNNSFKKEHLKNFIIEKCHELNIILPENINEIELIF